ncbi:hypothetical protein JXM67_04990 [candidate division WOR-3 bacterium]|nr:hypothetical protein [candidate division WOR-3 bacterium]
MVKKKKTIPVRPVSTDKVRTDIKIGWGWVLLGLSVLVLVLFINTLMKGHLIHGSDQLISGYMFKTFAKESIRATGEFPLWNPYIFSGLPYVDALHGDVFYITALLRMIFPVGTVMALVFILQIIAAGIFTYGFLRTLKLSNLVSVIGALSYMFTGAIVSFVDAGHDGKVIVASLLPAGLFMIQKAFDPETKKKLIYFALLALVIGMALLSPHVQMTYYMLMLMAFYIIFKFLVLGIRDKRWGYAGKSLGLSFGSLALGFAISAIQFLPSISYLAFSPRGAGGRGWEWNTQWSLPKMELVDLFNPRFSGILNNYWGSNAFKQHAEYFGIIILALMIVGIILAWKRRETKFFAGFGIFGVLMALGGNTPFYHIPYNIFPLLKSFRAPAMIFFTVSFSAVVLAMLGLQTYLDNPKPLGKSKTPLRTWGNIILSSVGGLLIILALWSTLAPSGFAKGMVGSIQHSVKRQLKITEQVTTIEDAGSEIGKGMVSLAINPPYDVESKKQELFSSALMSRGYSQSNLPSQNDIYYLQLIADRSFRMGQNMKNLGTGFWLALAFVAGTILILVLWGRLPKLKILWTLLMAAVVFTDLWLVDRHFVNIVKDGYGNPISAEELYRKDNVVNFLDQDKDLYRVYHLQLLGTPIYRNDDYLMLHGIQEVGGYHGNQLKRYQEFIGSPQTIMFRTPVNLRYQQFLTMLDVRYIIGLTPPDTSQMELYSPQDRENVRRFFADMAFILDTTSSPFRPAYSDQRLTIYRNLAPCSRAWLCTEVEVITDSSVILERMRKPDFDPRQTVILEEQPEGWMSSPDTSLPGEAIITKYEPNSIEITATLGKPAVLVLSENWYPYYRAWVDGSERKVYRADYTLRALPLESGRHEIVFRFSSPYQNAGTWITFVSLALIGLVVALSLILVRRKKKS